jgi:hypothetical protein
MATAFDVFFNHGIAFNTTGLDYVDLTTMQCVSKTFQIYSNEYISKHEEDLLNKAIKPRVNNLSNKIQPHSLNFKKILQFVVPLDRHCNKSSKKIIQLVNDSFNDVSLYLKDKKCSYFIDNIPSIQEQKNTIKMLSSINTDNIEKNMFFIYLTFIYVSEIRKIFSGPDIKNRKICILASRTVRISICNSINRVFEEMNNSIIFYPLSFLNKFKHNIGVVRSSISRL